MRGTWLQKYSVPCRQQSVRLFRELRRFEFEAESRARCEVRRTARLRIADVHSRNRRCGSIHDSPRSQ